MIKFNDFKDTLVVSWFPGVGKTHLFNNKEIDILDSDSSKFDKSDFPSNYIRHIKENLGKVLLLIFFSYFRHFTKKHDKINRSITDNIIEVFTEKGNRRSKSAIVNEIIKRLK